MSAISFDDPKPPAEKRKQQLIYLLPSIKEQIDHLRGKLTRSAWIERAVLEAIRRDKP